MRVTLYSKPSCQQCKATMRALDKARIAYDYIPDVTENIDLVESLKARANELGVAGGMPYVSVYNADNTLVADWFGFQPGLISKHLTAAK